MKKIPLLLLALGLGLVASLRAQTEAPAAAPAVKSPADLESDAIWANWRAEAPAGLTRNDRAFWKFQDSKMKEFSVAGRAFGAKYPSDSRRYDFYVQSSFTRPWFILDFKPEFDAVPRERNLIVDQPALNAYFVSQAKLLTEVIEATDSSTRRRGGAFFALLADARGAAQSLGTTFDITAYRTLVDRVVAKFGDERALPIVELYTEGLRQNSTTAATAYEATLQSNPAIAAAIAGANAKREAAAAEKAKKLTDIGSIKFTAADGREVELAKLKGKVVLVDFWATWCGPCVAELPNVVANYNKYHDKGFEVVGISLENPGAAPKDTPEQTAAKLEKAKQKMLEFTVKNTMPWPQYFDGKWWKNDYAVKFGIDAIPAMFLLDQSGNIVSTEARGPKLEAELKRLLKL